MAADEELSIVNGVNGLQSSVNGEVVAAPDGGSTASDNEKLKGKDAEKRRRRRKQKKKKSKGKSLEAADEENQNGIEVEEEVEVEYVFEEPELTSDSLGEGFEDLVKVFEKFAAVEKKTEDEASKEEVKEAKKEAKSDSDSDSDSDVEGAEARLSNKERKLKRRMKISELKQLALRPDVVEVWDTTATDPKLLVFLKSCRNSVPVPRHWSQKRKYLQGKRGIEKQPFQLPDFIAATGIEKLRQAYVEKEDQKKLKQKQKDKMQPKMGKMDIDYQVLHDAFFKYQTKPKLSHHGDLYFEGKEFEVKIRDYKPGQLSEDLKTALGMTEGTPPPWLINIQRYGPPPSYPHLKIPGLNAPIPEGAMFGYHPGGWGKPPVDEFGRPIYGDVFGSIQKDSDFFEDEAVDKTKRWGALEEVEEEDEEEEEEEEEDEEYQDGITSVDSISTTPAGVETPDVIDLRKAQKKDTDKNLYTVLEEKEERIAAGSLMGASHTYVLPGGAAATKKVDLNKSQKSDKVDITLRPEELEGLDDSALAAKYEQARQEEVPEREDFSDMVAQREMQRKRKAQEKEGKSKKQKEFKF